MYDDSAIQDRLAQTLNHDYELSTIYQDKQGIFYYPDESSREMGAPVRLNKIPAHLLEKQDGQLLKMLAQAGLNYEWSQITDDQGRIWTYGEESWNLPFVQLALF